MQEKSDMREQLWWLLTGYYNDQGIVPDIFLIERMVDLVMQRV